MASNPMEQIIKRAYPKSYLHRSIFANPVIYSIWTGDDIPKGQYTSMLGVGDTVDEAMESAVAKLKELGLVGAGEEVEYGW